MQCNIPRIPKKANFDQCGATQYPRSLKINDSRSEWSTIPSNSQSSSATSRNLALPLKLLEIRPIEYSVGGFRVQEEIRNVPPWKSTRACSIQHPQTTPRRRFSSTRRIQPRGCHIRGYRKRGCGPTALSNRRLSAPSFAGDLEPANWIGIYTQTKVGFVLYVTGEIWLRDGLLIFCPVPWDTSRESWTSGRNSF